jgi:C4-dicarboxylate-specific signal transduction histidine kinase
VRWAAGIAHEVSQPLTAISNLARACRHSLGDSSETVEESLGCIVDQAERATHIVRHLRNFVRRGERRRQQVGLHGLVAEVVEMMQADRRADQVEMGVDLPADLPDVWCDPIQIQQVLSNLVRNAIEAMVETNGAPHRVDISAERSGSDVAVSVVDSGPGLSAVAVDSLFQPFFTTKREGLGLGLSISRSIVEDHGGHLRLLPNEDVGGAFQFILPVAGEGGTLS